MILCINIGNTHLVGGLYHHDHLQLHFRCPSRPEPSIEQFANFLNSWLQENQIKTQVIKKVAVASVLPHFDAIVRETISQCFSLDTFFLTAEAVQPRLKIAYRNPQELGADRLSISLAASHRFPQQDLIVIDLGTATTFNVITQKQEFLGGLIMPGLYIAMKSLVENTAKLSPIEIIKPKSIIGNTTETNIQAGIYYEHLGAMREIINQITETSFKHPPTVIATGGFAHLFEQENIFHHIEANLVLEGIYLCLK